MRLNPFAAALRTAAWACAWTVMPALAQNLPQPTGGNFTGGDFVLDGSVTIPAPAGGVMSITQNGNFAHLSWESFNIANGNAVEITQDANAFLLNQVVGNNPSSILGRLSGPGGAATAGQVAVINPAGILVGATGVINVGGLIASSLGLDTVTTGNGSNPDVITLEAGQNGSNVNILSGATITAGSGGVVLAGRTVSNAGTVTSGGPIQIYGADGLEITSNKNNNDPRDPPTIDPASVVAVTAPGLTTLVNNTGTLSAAAAVTDANGVVRLVAAGGGVETGTVTSQGNGTGNGTILVSATDASGTDGDVTVGDLDAGGTGTVTIDASHRIQDNGDASDADVTSGTLIATAGTGIDLQTSISDLTASVTGTGDLLVDEIGSGITLTDVQTAAGSISISAGGDVTATSVAATGGAATLESTTAGGNITATSVTGAGVTLIADALDIGGAVDAGSGVALLRPQTDGTAISLGTEEAGQMSLTDTELDNVTAGQVTVGSTSSGNLTVNDSISPANTATLNLVSGGSIATAATKTITETTLTAGAGTSIDIDTDVSTLDASSGNGAVTVDEANGLTLRSVSAIGGNVTVTTTTGNITAGSVDATGNTVNLTAAAGSIADDGDGAGLTSITANTVNLTVSDGGTVGANTGSGTIPANYLDLAGTPTLALTGNAASAHVHLVTTSTVTSSQTAGLVASGRDLGIAVSNGDFSFDSAAFSGMGDGNLEVVANNIGLNHDTAAQQEISTTGNVLLRARTGAITDASDTNAALDISANKLTLDAVTGISADTAVADLDASIAGAGATGVLSITEADGITLSDVDHTNGSIAITAGGPITATAVDATGGNVNLTATGAGNGIATTVVSGTTVTLTAVGGAVTGTGVTATNLDVTGATIDLGTTVQNLNASASSGTLKINEADGISLTDVDNANGSIDITAAGAITATDVAATGGNVKLTATGGSNGISTALVSGTAVTLSAAGAVTGTGVAATDLDVTGATIDLGTTVQNLNASAGGGTLKITETNGITLTDVDNANGSIDISAAGAITATDVAATAGNVTLTATGAGNGISTTIVSGTNVGMTAPGAITGTGVSATGLTLSGGSISLGTSVGSLTATATSGDLSITESNGITLGNVATSNNGNISVTASAGDITVGTVNAGTGNVTLDADQVGTQQIRDDAAGTLDATTRITGNTITLLAGGGIGAGNEDVDIDGTSLVAQTTSGALNINEANAVALTTFTNNGGGDVALSTGSALTTGAISASGHTVRVETRDPGADLTVGGTLTGQTVALISGGAIVDGNATNPDVVATTLDATAASGIDLDTNVDSVSAAGGAGAISIDEAAGPLTLTSVGNTSGGITVNVAGGGMTVTRVDAGGGGTATLAASGAITGSGGGTHVTAQALSATSGDGGIDLNTAVSGLSATAGGTGGIQIDNTVAVALNTITTAAGNIRVDTAAGNITAGTITAGTGGNVTLTADGAGQSIRDDGNDGAAPTRVTGNVVTLTAGTDIGSAAEDLDTDANTNVATANGVINIDQTGGLVMDVTNPNGTTNATAGGPVTLASGSDLNFGTIRGDGVTIHVSGGDIFIGSGGQIDGRNGDVEVSASGDVTQAAGVDPAISGDAITVVAGGKVGLPNAPLTVDAGSGAVIINFTNSNGAAFISGVFGSLNEAPNILGLGPNTVLANNVGAIQSSFEERVSFRLDSSQFATETRIFSVEGTGVLPPEDQRE